MRWRHRCAVCADGAIDHPAKTSGVREDAVCRLDGADGFDVDSGGGQPGHEVHEFVLDIVRDTCVCSTVSVASTGTDMPLDLHGRGFRHAQVWLCDPIHGNGIKLHGVKTRLMDAMLAEVASFARVQAAHSQRPAGLHLELTPNPITGCVSSRMTEHPFRTIAQPAIRG